MCSRVCIRDDVVFFLADAQRAFSLTAERTAVLLELRRGIKQMREEHTRMTQVGVRLGVS